MRSRFSLRSLASVVPVVATLVGGLGACAPDAPSGPPAVQSPPPTAVAPLLGLDPLLQTTTTVLTGTVQTLGNTVGGLLGLLTCPSQDQLRTTRYIGPLGGKIAVGDHELVVPAGALSQTVQISATRLSGTVAQVDFQPHGLRFAKPATLRMSYSACSVPPGGVQSVVYLDDKNKIVEVPPSVDDAQADAVKAAISHFSGYAIATSRPPE